jgi:hypothetical protein
VGLLDSLLSGSQGGYGGLLDALMYQSPLTQPKPNYATNEFDSQFLPQAPDPFGGIPQMSQPQPGQFQPPSAFNGSAPAAPIQFAGAAPPPPAPMLPPPQAAAPAPEPAPQPQSPPAQNMQIGGYQMPQIGPASAYAPQPQTAQGPSTDISAQSRRPPSEMPSFLTPPSPGGFKDAMRGAMLNMAGGPIGMMMGAVGGGMGMLDPNPRDVQNQNLRAQFQAVQQTLIENGESPQKAASKAMLAVMNPEAGKTILSEALTNKEEYKAIKDGFGGEHPAFVNSRDQTINGKSIDEYNRSQGASLGGQQTYDNIAKAREGGASPEQLYQLAPPQLREGVRAMIEGRGIPTNLSARGDARNNALMLAHAIDPTFDETQIPGRVKGFNDFYNGGASSKALRSINQSALHFGELVNDKMTALPGHQMPAANAVENFANTNVLGKGAQGNFEVNAHALADELSTMFKGAGISDHEIKAWEQHLSPDMSPEQQRGMAKTLLGLYRDGVTAWDKRRLDSVGPIIAAQKGPILGPEAEAALSRVEKFAGGQNVTPQASSTLAPGQSKTIGNVTIRRVN